MSPPLSPRPAAAPLLLAALLVAGAAGAQGQAGDYSAQDVIRFFEGEAARPAAPAAGRPLCLGSAEECAETAAPAGSAPAAATTLRETETIERQTLLDRAPTFDLLVTFELNSARLTREARERLSRFAEAADSPGLARLRFRIEGHTDALGEDAANLDLSRRRAAAVVAFLEERGVASTRLSSIGFGETRPREPDPFDPRNRRVEGRLLTGAEPPDGPDDAG